MWKKRLCFVAAAGGLVTLLSLPVFSTAAKEQPAAKGKDQRATCYQCHEEVKALKEGSKHARLACETCHENLAKHLESQGEVKPVTLFDHTVCGTCHKDQYQSFFKVDYRSEAHREKGIPGGRSPMMDKLLAPYGFVIEHNEPRGHPFMITDQFIVDRFAGGRFQYQKGWQSVDAVGKTWDILEDKGPDFKVPETGKAGNPTCIQCKSSDHILTWKFLGDKDPKARWDRTSDIVAVAKDTNNVMGCIHCHDPHGAQPRIVRDELIHQIENGSKMFAGKDGTTDLKVIDFRGFRKIGIMKKSNSAMMCAQCHVEYACGKGIEFDGGKPVGFEDRRTNHMPLVQVKEVLAHYKKQNYFDFKHAVTGARLVKLQHPEMETFLGSVHQRAGVGCVDCHMPMMKNKQGKAFRSHMAIKPKNYVKESCLGCHAKSSVEEKKYELDAIQNYTRGKTRKAEYWLGQLIDTYAVAKRAGVDEAVLAQAREKHEEAHVLWEWWTAENSDGFHNPGLARETLGMSIATSKEGVAILNKALEPKKP